MADVSTIKNKLADAGAASKQAISAAQEQVANAAGYVAENTKRAASAVADNVSNAAGYLGEQAENASGTVSGGLKSVARSIRQNAPQEGNLGDAATGVAQTFSNAAGYLDQQGFEGIGKDLAAVIKNNPLPALMLSIGLGFLCGRACLSRDN